MTGIVPEEIVFNKDIKGKMNSSHVESALKYLIERNNTVLIEGEQVFYVNDTPKSWVLKVNNNFFGIKAVVRVACLYLLGVTSIKDEHLKEVHKIPQTNGENSKPWTWFSARDLLTDLGYNVVNLILGDIKQEHVENALDYIVKYGEEEEESGLLHIPFDGEGALGKGKPRDSIRGLLHYEGKNFWVKDVVRIAYLYSKGVNPSPKFRQEDIARGKTIKGNTDSMKKFLNEMGYTSEHAEIEFPDKEKSSNDKKLPGDDKKLPEIFQYFHQIIFYGPPGTGKTYAAKKFVAEVFGVDKEKLLGLQGTRWNIVQFHPSYNYEDFVRGVKVKTDDKGNIAYETGNRIFGDMCQRAQDNPNNKYVLIIDEINRANVSAVLGELIYALEYRGEGVKTPYDVGDGEKGMLVIPKNLYIIGTMNTADRTIGQIDYAVRRRFAFIPCLPDRNVVSAEAKGVFNSVDKIFYNHLSQDYDKDDVRIGHSYFMASGEELTNKIIYQVVPILREYVKDGVLLSEAKEEINKIEKKAKGLPDDEMENEIDGSVGEERSSPSKKHHSFSWKRKDGKPSNGAMNLGRTVLSIVQDYVEQNPSITIDELREWFPDKGRIDNMSRGIKLKTDSFDSARFFTNEKDQLNVGGEIAYVTTQWGNAGQHGRGNAGSFEDFRDAIREKGYFIRDENEFEEEK